MLPPKHDSLIVRNGSTQRKLLMFTDVTKVWSALETRTLKLLYTHVYAAL